MKKAKIWKFVIVFIISAGFTAACYFVFDALGVLNKQDIKKLLGGRGIVLAFLIYILLFVIQAVFLSLLPGNVLLFIGVGYFIFGNYWLTFTAVIIANFVSSLLLYAIGKYGGRHVLEWLFGQSSIDKYLGWVSTRGAKIFPFLFLIPVMPNDLLCIVCGAVRIKFWVFLLIVAVFRTFEVLLLILYISYLSNILFI